MRDSQKIRRKKSVTDSNRRARIQPTPTWSFTICPGENGWRYVATLRKLFHVFMAEDADAPELHTDPVVQSDTLKKVSRQLRFSFWCFMGITLVMLGSTVQLLSRGDWVRSLLLDFNTGIYVLVPVYIVLCVFLGISTGRIARIRRRLSAGRPYDHHGHYRRGVTLRTLELLIILVCIAVLVASLYITSTTGFRSIRSLSDAPDDMPILSLEAIDPVYADYSDGHFYREYSPLVPEQYVVLRNFHPDADSVRTVLQTEYYKAVSHGLAGAVYDEMLRSSFARINVATAEYEMPDYETLDTPFFDAAGLRPDQKRAVRSQPGRFCAIYRGPQRQDGDRRPVRGRRRPPG